MKRECRNPLRVGKTKLHMMNFFKIKTSWSNAELIPLKLCIGSAYIVVGTYFHSFLRSYYIPILVLFGITVVWSVYLWISKMMKQKKE
jgi:hypothetical protein